MRMILSLHEVTNVLPSQFQVMDCTMSLCVPSIEIASCLCSRSKNLILTSRDVVIRTFLATGWKCTLKILFLLLPKVSIVSIVQDVSRTRSDRDLSCLNKLAL
jgi:hypothetical protein